MQTQSGRVSLNHKIVSSFADFRISLLLKTVKNWQFAGVHQRRKMTENSSTSTVTNSGNNITKKYQKYCVINQSINQSNLIFRLKWHFRKLKTNDFLRLITKSLPFFAYLWPKLLLYDCYALSLNLHWVLVS